MKSKRPYTMVPVLFRIVGRWKALRVSVASPRDVARFGGAGRLDASPIGFIRKVRSTRLREVLRATT